jgi:glycerophosphoryl diester phosphodiesterase
MLWGPDPPPRPLAIAHRAANDAALLRKAAEVGVDIVEADVWVHRGRIEVRHLKTMGPIPFLWDRWELVPGWWQRVYLHELLPLVPPHVHLMLDLKGNSVAASERIAAELRGYPGPHPTVCARRWSILEPFRGAAVNLVHSAGTPRQLRALQELLRRGEANAVSIHQKLLTPEVVADLRHDAVMLMTWPVNQVDRMRDLVSWGVNGIISDSLEVLEELLETSGARAAPRPPAQTTQ